MTEIVIIARIVPEEGQTDSVHNAIDALASASREEAGNKGYSVFLSDVSPAEFLIHEIWADAEAVTNHGRMPHMTTFKKSVQGKARISVQKLTEL